MSQALYEQYKEALRQGHVAALRGRLDVAEAAYRAAAAMAPDRALPHTSLGGVLRRQGRTEEALEAYGVALSRAPDDERALLGRAEALADVGRRTAAALDHETLAGVLERSGRLADAGDAAWRALELAESRSRRRAWERLAAMLTGAGEDLAVVEALDRALGVLEPDSVEDAGGRRASDGAPIPERAQAQLAAAPAEAVGAEPWVAPGPPPDPEVLRAVADALLDSGDVSEAADRLLALAAVHRDAGRHDAAMDACLALLAVRPSDHRLQIEIAAIQLDRGHLASAAEKLLLLARLAGLDGNAAASAAVAAFASERDVDLPPLDEPAG